MSRHRKVKMPVGSASSEQERDRRTVSRSSPAAAAGRGWSCSSSPSVLYLLQLPLSRLPTDNCFRSFDLISPGKSSNTLSVSYRDFLSFRCFDSFGSCFLCKRLLKERLAAWHPEEIIGRCRSNATDARLRLKHV